MNLNKDKVSLLLILRIICAVFCVGASGPHLPVELLLPVTLLFLSLTLQQDLVLPLGLLLLLSSFQGVPQDSDLAILQQNLVFHLLQLVRHSPHVYLGSVLSW